MCAFMDVYACVCVLWIYGYTCVCLLGFCVCVYIIHVCFYIYTRVCMCVGVSLVIGVHALASDISKFL